MIFFLLKIAQLLVVKSWCQEKGANAELLEMLEGAEKEMQVYSAKVDKDSGSKDMMSPD